MARPRKNDGAKSEPNLAPQAGDFNDEAPQAAVAPQEYGGPAMAARERLRRVSERLKSIEEERATLLNERISLIEEAHAEGGASPAETLVEGLARTSRILRECRVKSEERVNPGQWRQLQQQVAAMQQKNKG